MTKLNFKIPLKEGPVSNYILEQIKFWMSETLGPFQFSKGIWGFLKKLSPWEIKQLKF